MDYLIYYQHQTGAVLQTLDNGVCGLLYYPPIWDNVSSVDDNGCGLCGEGLFSNCVELIGAAAVVAQQLEGFEFEARVCAILQMIIGNDCKPQLRGIVEKCLIYIIG